MLAVDDATKPPTVRLLLGDAPRLDQIPTQASRIRRDLWNAVVDYRSGQRYLWNGLLAQREDESSPQDRAQFLILPTVSESELDQWRAQFVSTQLPLVADRPALQAQAERWRDKRLGTTDLPAALRGRWNAELKKAVAQRLTNWFVAQSLSVPTDQATLRREALSLAQDRNMAAVTRRTKRCVVEGSPEAHRRFELIEPRDAGELYKAMHRRDVLVFAVVACFVRSDPSASPTRLRHTRRLEEYVRYKARYGLARGPGNPSSIFTSFAD